MRMIHWFAAMLMLAGPAATQATIKLVTVSGIMSSGTDTSPYFGVGPNHAGHKLTIRLFYDTSYGARQTIPGISDTITNHPTTGIGPVRHVQAKINGVSQVGMPNAAAIVQTDPVSLRTLHASTEDRIFHTHRWLFQFNLDFLNAFAPLSLTDDVARVTLTNVTPDVSGFYLRRSVIATDETLMLRSGYFGPTVSFSVVTRNAVPEPEAWQLLIGGFALIGITRRRQQRATT